MHTARRVTSLPENFYYRGEPTAWVRMTRPGQRLHSFLEGLVVAPDGTFYLADVPYGRIFKISPDLNEWSELLHYGGEPHGLALARQGELLIADYTNGILSADLSSGTIEVVCNRHNGKPFKGLSDLTIDDNSALWFTDPGRTSLSDPTGRLFRLTPGHDLACVVDNIPYPNGIAISPDGTFVYIAVTRANAVWRLLRVSPEDRPMVGTFIQLSGGLGPDGLAVSKRGELAVAQAQAGRVYVFDKLGDEIARVQTPAGLWTTSVRFGGENDRTLYIVDAETASIFAWDWRR
jgi:gluconolactonase